METLKVSSKTKPNSVAGALAGLLKDSKEAQIQVVGAGAINQAIKAIAITRDFLKPFDIELACIPSFIDIEIGGEIKTGINLSVKVL